MTQFKIISVLLAGAFGVGLLSAWANINTAQIDTTSCQDITAALPELKNGFGMAFKIIHATDHTEVMRTKTSLECTAKLMLDTGAAETFKLIAFEKDSSIFYSISQI